MLGRIGERWASAAVRHEAIKVMVGPSGKLERRRKPCAEARRAIRKRAAARSDTGSALGEILRTASAVEPEMAPSGRNERLRLRNLRQAAEWIAARARSGSTPGV